VKDGARQAASRASRRASVAAPGGWNATRDPADAPPADAVRTAGAVSRRGCADAMSPPKSTVGPDGALAGAKARERGSSWDIFISSRQNLREIFRIK
jgi:hypothetical protein